jgi:hypothetical protein
MAQVSIGQVENLEDLMRGLESIREGLESACQEQIATAEQLCETAQEETQTSEEMLEQTIQAEQEAQQQVQAAQQQVQTAQSSLSSAQSALSSCEASGSYDEDGNDEPPDCSSEEADVTEAEVALEEAEAGLEEAQEALEKATEDRQTMEQRVELAKQALSMAEQALEQAQQECTQRMQQVENSIEAGKARLASAQQALEAYLAMNPSAAQFHKWLHWQPEKGKPITPDVLRDRMNLSFDQQRLLQEYLYDRNGSYRNMVDRYRSQWNSAKGDVERNMINRNARIHISGEYAEQMARYALAPLGGKIDTQGRTYVGDNGRYTKTDLIVSDLRVPVILGRGEKMGAPVGGSIAFEVKCGKPSNLYSKKEHMIFQAEGHKQADAHCTLCSRDIHDLSPEEEKELRDAMREAGSPLVGMLPAKNEIDKSCLDAIHQDEETD